MEAEIWKDIPNYEGIYQVSNFGNVKSLERLIRIEYRPYIQKEIVLKAVKNANGYLSVSLYKKGKQNTFDVHLLVAIAFLNHTPSLSGLKADHIDENKFNNRLDNLQVITNRENVERSIDRTKTYSKYAGVTKCKKTGKFQAQIHLKQKTVYLGSFTNEYEAHLAYQEKLKTINN